MNYFRNERIVHVLQGQVVRHSLMELCRSLGHSESTAMAKLFIEMIFHGTMVLLYIGEIEDFCTFMLNLCLYFHVFSGECFVSGVTCGCRVFLFKFVIRLYKLWRRINSSGQLCVLVELAGEISRVQRKRILHFRRKLCWPLCASACTYHSLLQQDGQ